MRHVSKEALLAGATIIRKGDDNDPVSIVTKALDDLTRSVDERLKKLETTGGGPDKKDDAPDIKALSDRLADLEKKTNRPGGGKADGDQQADAERKALSAYVRTGSDLEIKQATSSSDPEGGYFILPTVDLTIRNQLKDVSPLRQLAEVVSISGNTYERFYSTGNRGAQWVGETETRPQDTARPNLIKHSYSPDCIRVVMDCGSKAIRHEGFLSVTAMSATVPIQGAGLTANAPVIPLPFAVASSTTWCSTRRPSTTRDK